MPPAWSSALGRSLLLGALCALPAACVIPEPDNAEDAGPANLPDNAPLIRSTDPVGRTVIAEPAGADAGCQITLNLTVLDPTEAPLSARVFVNDGNPAAAGPTQFPVAVGGIIDVPLVTANQLDPQIQDFATGLVLPLAPLVAEQILVPPSQGGNYVELLVSDGWATEDDPVEIRDPAPGKAVTEAFWLIDDLSRCDPWLGYVPE